MVSCLEEAEQPWQRETRLSGLLLHAPADMAVDAAVLRAQFLALSPLIHPDMPGYCMDGGRQTEWCMLGLLARSPPGDTALPEPLPGLAHMQLAATLAARPGWQVLGMHVARQRPGGGLPWHWDDQGLHRSEIRLIIPIHTPAGAVTRIGHESIVYPAGRAWTADFTPVHEVWNHGSEDRITLVLDIAVSPMVTALFPPALAADADRREALALRTREHLQDAWVARRVRGVGASLPAAGAMR
ncbi:aspartyl/asparaginyl beta-hydroxylase domain-containing protein [Niveispirillum sp. KHB5.9]|uniref:aspartyl/asparaginyl beta-hydroxylase domain-containing protein n=1 Tax=Niveispirillum sp. KHB5.9 TaxID=3400269 RepID=UPI003A85F98B